MIISIYGQNKAGKSTLADMLVSEYRFVKISFADALREIAQMFFEVNTSWKTNEEWLVDYDYLNGIDRLFSVIKDKDNIKQLMIDKIKHATTKDQAYRITLELLGTEVFRRMVSNDIWCSMAAFAIIRSAWLNNDVVCDDLRFPNEYEILDKLNTIFIRIISPYEESVGEHESQKYVNDFRYDYTIYNDGTKKELSTAFYNLGFYE